VRLQRWVFLGGLLRSREGCTAIKHRRDLHRDTVGCYHQCGIQVHVPLRDAACGEKFANCLVCLPVRIRTDGGHSRTSALAPIADLGRASGEVRFVPRTGRFGVRAITSSVGNLIRPCEKSRRPRRSARWSSIRGVYGRGWLWHSRDGRRNFTRAETRHQNLARRGWRRRAIELDRLEHRAYTARGLLQLQLARYDDALADLRRACDLNSNDASALISLAYGETMYGDGRSAKTISCRHCASVRAILCATTPAQSSATPAS
jgi:hypothetical protein